MSIGGADRGQATGMAPPTRANFSCDPATSRGRFRSESVSPTRSLFQRDRDRIIHSAAFRRLKDKTQVFVYHEGDHYRTRLTHSLEVAQISRSIARTLGIDEDLTEALALAHDLGHTPFGHAGERTIDRCMLRHGGFDHNAQTLRIVTRLERRYAEFDGLNLTIETLEGLVKHNGPLVDRRNRAIGAYADRGIPAAIRDFENIDALRIGEYATAEAQVAALSDDIAYNAHDIDDGLRAHLFDIMDVADVPIVGDALGEVVGRYPNLERSRVIHETVRRVISRMVDDLLGETRARISRDRPGSADDVRALGHPLIAFSAEMADRDRELKAFLGERMYRHEMVLERMARAQRIVRDLFEAYMDDSRRLPPEWQPDEGATRGDRYARRVCDFIAGMTDRYAIDQHRRLFDVDPIFR
jgi:dGTPase